MNIKGFLLVKDTDPRLSELILCLSTYGKIIKDGFLASLSKAGTKNVYGEEQMELDKWADSVIINGLRNEKLVHYITTEEQPDIIEINNPKNQFGITVDPLDGSSLIGVNLAVGTIIGIYPGHIIDKGQNMIVAMYILYGPLTTLTLTIGKWNGVHEFVMNNDGEFNLTKENIRIPDGKIYAPGALRKDYLPGHMKFIESLEKDGYKLRFSGSFVADVHQILHKGCIFTYPGFKGKEKGKLRLLFEANPMGKIITEAGGATYNGSADILSVIPHSIDEITPVYIGGKKEIDLIKVCMQSNNV